MPPATASPLGPPDGKAGDSGVRRLLFTYRVLLALLVLALVAVLLWQPRSAKPDVETFDVGARATDAAKQHPEWPDLVEVYFSSPAGSVHLHAMAPRQICPLHLHETTEELTLIVAGTASVTQLYDAAGSIVERSGQHPTGSLVHSPRFAGHEWRNEASDALLGNLVFTSPRYVGNAYVSRDDARLHGARAPFVYDLAARIAQFSGAGDPHSLEVLPLFGGALSVLLLKDRYTLESANQDTLVYVHQGTGSLAAQKVVPLVPMRLVVVRRSSRIELSAENGSPLALVIFRVPSSS